MYQIDYDVTDHVFGLLPGPLENVSVELLDVSLAVGLGREGVVAGLAFVRTHPRVSPVVPEEIDKF